VAQHQRQHGPGGPGRPGVHEVDAEAAERDAEARQPACDASYGRTAPGPRAVPPKGIADGAPTGPGLTCRPLLAEQCLKNWLQTPNTQARGTVTGYRSMVRHLTEPIGNVKLAELKVRDVDFALSKLGERPSTRSVRLARMILILAIRNAPLCSRNSGD
jgi:hypothetical protein